MNGPEMMKYSKGKKGSRILTHNGTKRHRQTFLCFLVKNETKKRQQFHWRSKRKVLDYCFRLINHNARWFDMKAWKHDQQRSPWEQWWQYKIIWHGSMKAWWRITLRTMITMRIMAVKLPMMIPMTRDIVGDIPDNVEIFNHSTHITIGQCFSLLGFLLVFRSPWSQWWKSGG